MIINEYLHNSHCWYQLGAAQQLFLREIPFVSQDFEPFLLGGALEPWIFSSLSIYLG